MKNKPKVLIFLIIITIIIIIILLLLLYNIMKNDLGYQDAIESEDESILYTETEVAKPVTNDTMFYTVSNCIQKYLSICSNDLNEAEKKESLYSMLNPKYIEKNNITIDNIDKYTHYTLTDLYFMPKKMNFIEKGTIEVYSVYGRLREKQDYSNIKVIYFIVTVDKSNSAFLIEPLMVNQDIDINQIKLKYDVITIQKNTNNIFEYDRVSKSDLPNRYLEHYKELALYNPVEAYEYLNKEYREKRFGSLENYIQYVNDNRIYISNIFASKYQITYKDNYTQYVCIDNKGNYYTFQDTATMNYELLLDNHTMDLPEFKEKYEAGNEQVKVGMNIEKIVDAINTKDYKYIYSKLSDEFKNNYFKSEEELSQYIKDFFPEYNTVNYLNFSNEGNTYMYEVRITDKNKETIKIFDTIIFMRLEENNDFVFSFKVNENRIEGFVQ